MGPIRLTIVTPYRQLLDQEVESVTAPGLRGEFQVLPDHSPYLIQLVPGEVAASVSGDTQRYAISGGIAEVQGGSVQILAETAEEATEIDMARAVQAKEDAESVLAGTTTDEEYNEARGRLEKAVARMHVGR